MTTRRFPLDPGYDSVHAARLAVRETLQHCGIGDTALAELATSELVSNAIRHGSAPMSVVVRCAGRLGRVEVHDASPELPARPVGGRAADRRGLAIVEAFTSSWGVEPTTAGKAVWFQVSGRRHPA